MKRPKGCTCVYATARNEPAVRAGAEMGGYVKEFCELCKASRLARETLQRERMNARFENRLNTPATADFDLAAPNDGFDKPKQGRPPKPADQQTKPYSIRLTDAEIVKLKVIGMDRLRAWLRNTKTEKPLAGTNQT